jgi:hypothetical protein
MILFSLASSLIFLLIHIGHIQNLVQGWALMHGYLFTYWSFFLFKLASNIFFHYIAHLIGLPSYFNPWFVTLHLCLTFGFCGDPPYFLHPWWGEDDFLECCVGFLSTYHKKCGISCFTWANPHSFNAYLLVFALTSQHCGFWWMVFRCWLTSPLLTPLEQIWFCGQLYLMGLLQQSQFELKMVFIAINSQWTCLSF